VDALVVSGVERAGFLWIEGQIAEALTGTHFPWAQDQVIGFPRRGSRSRYLERASLTVARV
jgi:hypothetical protein